MKRILLILCAGALLLSVAACLFASIYRETPGPFLTDKSVILPRGTGLRGIAETLAREGVIDYLLMFEALAYASGESRKFKAGEYLFPMQSTPAHIIEMLAQGRTVVRKLTIPEGLTTREILSLVQAAPGLQGDLPIAVQEGELLPETYHYSYGDSRAEMIGRMQKSLQALVAEQWPKRAQGLPVTSEREALTLASIVEKETGVSSERPRVASVFINRLRAGMKLQSDPTVAYGIEAAQGRKLGRLLTSNDLAEPTPYNTYTISALPPGPIANPGRASILAVLHPAETGDYYFVANGTGGHAFAATLAQHNRNVAAYRRWLRSQ